MALGAVGRKGEALEVDGVAPADASRSPGPKRLEGRDDCLAVSLARVSDPGEGFGHVPNLCSPNHV